MGLWRYSMAALIVIAALLDVLWWVPAQQARDPGVDDAPVSATLPRCRQ